MVKLEKESNELKGKKNEYFIEGKDLFQTHQRIIRIFKLVYIAAISICRQLTPETYS